MLTNLFLEIFERSIMAGIIICVVLLIRGTIFAKFPKKYAYLLWIVVGIRLVCPFEIPSPISSPALPWSTELAHVDVQQPAEEDVYEEDMANPFKVSDGVGATLTENNGVNMRPAADEIGKPEDRKNVQHENKARENIQHEEMTEENMPRIFTIIWLVGISIIIIYNLILYLRMKRHLQRGIKYRENIYECEEIAGPFVIGIRKPVIYIPFRLGEQEREYILQHEMFHIKRHDNLIKILAFLLVAVYWFQPLVWVAWIYMVRDMEMSCDEHVLSKVDNEVKKQYSLSLLAFATNERKYSVELLHFGEKNVKGRIRYIMKMKESKKWIGGLAVVLIVVVGAVCMTLFGTTKTQKKEDNVLTEKTTKSQSTDNSSTNTGVIEKTGDVTGDGIADIIRVDSAAANNVKEVLPVITVISGESKEVIYTIDNNEINAAVHPGFKSYYLYHGETQDYLLLWNPEMYQDIASYHWNIFSLYEYVKKKSLNDPAKKQVLEKKKLSFDGNHPKESDISNLKKFEEELNEKLQQAELLIDTIDGELKTDASGTVHLYDASETIKQLEFSLNGKWGEVLKDNYDKINEQNGNGEYRLSLVGKYAKYRADLGEIYKAGNDILITKQEVEQAEQFFILAGVTKSKARESAEEFVEELNALYVEAVKNGFDVTPEEIEEYLKELKETLANAENQEQVDGIMSGFGTEQEYWDYQYTVYQKELPIQKYAKYREKEFIKTQDKELSDVELQRKWGLEYEAIKKSLAKAQNFHEVGSAKDISKEFKN